MIDLTDPANPRRVGGYESGGSAVDVAVGRGCAYLVWRWDSNKKGLADLEVVDVSDSTNPVPVGGYDAIGHYCALECD